MDKEVTVAFGYCEAVKEFTGTIMESKGEEVLNAPRFFDPKFITQMIQDELEELAEAKTVAEQADALVDLMYYACDTAVRNGINLDSVFMAVHAANMEKFVDGKPILREDGKVLKPEGWVEPNIERIMDAQIKLGSWGNE